MTSILYLMLSAQLAQANMFPKGAFSNQALGTTAASFLKLSVSPRSSALADSISLNQMDALGGLNSPAAYSSLAKQKNISFAGGLLPEDILQAAVSAGFPRGWNDKWAVSIHEILQPSLSLYDALGTKTGEFRPSDTSIGAGYGYKNKDLAWGAGLSYINSRIGPGLTGWGVASNFSVNWLHGCFNDPNLAAGLAVVNLGPPAQWGSKSTPLPFKGQAEVIYKLLDELSNLNLGLAFPSDQGLYGLASLEWNIPLGYSSKYNPDPAHNFAVRLGVSTKNKTDGFTKKLSFGVGLAWGNIITDISLASFGNLGFFPRLGLNVGF